MTLSNFPNVMPAMTLDFRNSRQLDPRITFTRASAAGVIGEGNGTVNGSLHEFPENVPRLTDQGLLVEMSRTNLLVNSVITTNNWTTSNATTSNNTAETAAPDGTNTAAKFVPNNGQEGTCSTFNQSSISVTDGTAYTFSVWAKPTHSDYTVFNLRGDVRDAGGTNFNVLFTLSGNGSVDIDGHNDDGNADSAHIERYANGWYRCIVTQTADATTTEEPGFGAGANGDGTKGFYVWGYQVEEGAFATSYIPTNGATVTRAAEQAVIQGTDFTELWNTTNGTWVAFGGPTWDIPQNVSFVRVDADSSNFAMAMNLRAAASPDDNFLQGMVKETATSSWNMTSPNIYGDHRVAMTWAANPAVTATISVDGNSLTRVTTLDLNAAINKMQIGSYRGTLQHASRISSVSYYTSTFTANQLEALTEQ